MQWSNFTELNGPPYWILGLFVGTGDPSGGACVHVGLRRRLPDPVEVSTMRHRWAAGGPLPSTPPPPSRRKLSPLPSVCCWARQVHCVSICRRRDQILPPWQILLAVEHTKHKRRMTENLQHQSETKTKRIFVHGGCGSSVYINQRCSM